MATKSVKILARPKMIKYIQDTFISKDEAFLEIEKMLDKSSSVRIDGVKTLGCIRSLVSEAMPTK